MDACRATNPALVGALEANPVNCTILSNSDDNPACFLTIPECVPNHDGDLTAPADTWVSCVSSASTALPRSTTKTGPSPGAVWGRAERSPHRPPPFAP